MIPSFRSFASVKRSRLRGAIVDVVDRLRALDQRILEQLERGLGAMVIDRDAPVQDLSLALEALHAPARLGPLVRLEPEVVPDVELLQLERLDAEVAQRLLDAVDHVTRGEGARDGRGRLRRPLVVHRRHLRGDDEPVAPLVARDDLAQQPLAVTVSVGERRVEERDSGVQGRMQRAARVVVARAAPEPSADAPGAEADFRDVVSGASERAGVHGRRTSTSRASG
jgi:hypothetical protein